MALSRSVTSPKARGGMPARVVPKRPAFIVPKISAISGGSGKLSIRAKNLPMVPLKLAHQSSSGRSVWITLASGKAMAASCQAQAPGQSTWEP